MIKLVVLFAIACFCDARPGMFADIPTPFGDGIDYRVIGGNDANPGAYPHQLSQERFGTVWSHSCGSSLLRTNAGLSAAHCVDGASVANLRVRAGVHDRSNSPNAQTVELSRYVMHENYNNGEATYANDIAILHLVSHVTLGSTVALAALPADNENDFSSVTCVITGWGRTSSSNVLPNVLQEARVGILNRAQCTAQGIGASISDGHICIKDPNNEAGACNGDSGGPVNCPYESRSVVAGIASFVFAAAGNCLPGRPSVYTRTGYYLDWINTHAP